jgi:hypothetical protein
LEEISEPVRSSSGRAARAASSGTERHRKEGTSFSSDLLQAGRNPGLAEILLGQHVGRHLAPGFRHLDVLEPEDDGAVRVADLARGEPEGEGG